MDSRPSIRSCWATRSLMSAMTGWWSRPVRKLPAWPSNWLQTTSHRLGPPLDVMVEDVAAATPYVLALGARKLDGDDVFADPAGHPFCLIKRPGWADPLPQAAGDARS